MANGDGAVVAVESAMAIIPVKRGGFDGQGMVMLLLLIAFKLQHVHIVIGIGVGVAVEVDMAYPDVPMLQLVALVPFRQIKIRMVHGEFR